MAKKKKVDIEVVSDLSDFDFINELVGELQDINPYASTMHNAQIYDIADWIDMGIPALNMIVSGQFTRGLPSGRMTQLYGESQSGKSLIASQIAINAQKKGYTVALMESEFGESKESLMNKGLNPKKTILLPIKTLNSWHKCIRKIIDIKARNPNNKIIMITDSIGNIGSEYESEKLIDSKSDMGHRQKKIRSIFKDITIDLGVMGIPFVFTNHTYDDPNSFIKSKVKNMSGGGGVKFMPTITVQFNNGSAIKDGDQVVGRILKPYTVKNRIVPPYMVTELELIFQSGFKKYSGLLPLALKYNLLQLENGKVYVPHLPKIKRSVRGKKIEDHPIFKPSDIMDGEIGDNIWCPIINDLESKCMEDNAYFSPEIEELIEAEKRKIQVNHNEEN